MITGIELWCVPCSEAGIVFPKALTDRFLVTTTNDERELPVLVAWCATCGARQAHLFGTPGLEEADTTPPAGPLTEKGKEIALEGLRERRKRFANQPRIDNSSLPAGDPMFYNCTACGAEMVEAENWLTRRKICLECDALRVCGWLE